MGDCPGGNVSACDLHKVGSKEQDPREGDGEEEEGGLLTHQLVQRSFWSQQVAPCFKPKVFGICSSILSAGIRLLLISP